MKRSHLVAGGIIALLALLAAILAIFWPTGHHSHKATCWKPGYAAAPTATWAKHPSSTHRHGAGPRGSDVCDGAK